MKRYIFLWLLLLFQSSVVHADFDLTIIHTNDLHAHLLPFDRYHDCALKDKACLGGFARLTSYIKTARNQQTIILDAGDRFTGTGFYTLLKRKYLTPLFQNIPYDVITLGNHEFDDNLDETEKFLADWHVPVVVSNLSIAPTEPLAHLIRPSVILERSGHKIGIIGVLTDETNIMNGAPISILPIQKSVAREVQKLKQVGIDTIIVLSHIGLDEDKKLASSVPDIDVIVGGHSHSLLTNTMSNPDRQGPYPILLNRGKTALVSCGIGGQYVCRLDITFDDRGNIRKCHGDALPLSAEIEPDARAEALIAQAQREVDAILAEPIATLGKSYGLSGEKNDCREDCPIGDYITYLLHAAYPEVDGVLVNSGSLRKGLAAGQITYSHLIDLCPFDNEAVLVTMTGAELTDYLNHGVASYSKDSKTNALLQAAGIRYEFDADRRRVLRIQIGGKPLDPAKKYTILTSSFLADGGDRFPAHPAKPTGKTIRGIIKEQLGQHPDFIPPPAVVRVP